MAERPIRILLVEDDAGMREALAMQMESWGYEVETADGGVEAESLIESDEPDVLITDVVLPGISGLELLERLERKDVCCPIIVMTAHGSVDWAVEAMKRGAMDFLTKPVDEGHLASLIEHAVEEVRLRGRTRSLEEELQTGGLGGVVGRSPAIREVFDSIRILEKNDASAILWGETGVGKEVVARTIHERSARKDGPFVAVNTAAIPEGLIESEIFGHEKGAFTGAVTSRKGCFEQADGGTLLLDELGDMPLALQPRLLRILEEGRTRRLGGSRDVFFDVRVLAATNRDIDALVEDGIVREDLFYRLNVFTVRVPALRERVEDIPLLAHHFLQRFNAKHGTDVQGLRSKALQALESYAWPGNVRELRNVLERATILAEKGWVEASHLPPYVRRADDVTGRDLVLPLGISAAEAEKRVFLATLDAVGGNKSEAARRLGVDPKTIYNKLKEYEAGE